MGVRTYANSTVVCVPYHDRNEAIIEWCKDNTCGEVEIHPISDGMARVLFEFSEEAVLFSLKWSSNR